MIKLHSKKETAVAQELGSEVSLFWYTKHANFFNFIFIDIQHEVGFELWV
jgi:hypothetical protein